jgi:hypothetical protein
MFFKNYHPKPIGFPIFFQNTLDSSGLSKSPFMYSERCLSGLATMMWEHQQYSNHFVWQRYYQKQHHLCSFRCSSAGLGGLGKYWIKYFRSEDHWTPLISLKTKECGDE